MKGLKVLGQVAYGPAMNALRRGEGVYLKQKNSAKQLARKYSTRCGGGGNVEFDAAHKPGGYPHYHALDAAGERLPGHIWFGEASMLMMMTIFDVDGDGVVTGLDVIELASPLPWSQSDVYTVPEA